MYYGNFDGYSFCKDYYDLSITSVDGTAVPEWVTVCENTVSIKARTELDQKDEATIKVVVTLDGQTMSDRNFDVELTCDGNLCNGGTHHPLPDTVPVYDDLIGGFLGENQKVDSWYVPKRFYRLFKIDMYRNANRVSGFKVTYKRPDSDYFYGWPMYLEHTFGSDHLTEDYRWEYLEKDLESISLCVNTDDKVELNRDFRGFDLKQYGEYNVDLTLQKKCNKNQRTTIDLTRSEDTLAKRVIGF